jgi:hypothetical protein
MIAAVLAKISIEHLQNISLEHYHRTSLLGLLSFHAAVQYRIVGNTEIWIQILRGFIVGVVLYCIVFIQCSRYPPRWIQNLSIISTYKSTTRVVYMKHSKSLKYKI